MSYEFKNRFSIYTGPTLVQQIAELLSKAYMEIMLGTEHVYVATNYGPEYILKILGPTWKPQDILALPGTGHGDTQRLDEPQVVLIDLPEDNAPGWKDSNLEVRKKEVPETAAVHQFLAPAEWEQKEAALKHSIADLEATNQKLEQERDAVRLELAQLRTQILQVLGSNFK